MVLLQIQPIQVFTYGSLSPLVGINPITIHTFWFSIFFPSLSCFIDSMLKIYTLLFGWPEEVAGAAVNFMQQLLRLYYKILALGKTIFPAARSIIRLMKIKSNPNFNYTCNECGTQVWRDWKPWQPSLYTLTLLDGGHTVCLAQLQPRPSNTLRERVRHDVLLLRPYPFVIGSENPVLIFSFSIKIW